MNAFILVSAIILGQITVDVAPERAEPFSYMDEPLALRINGLLPGVHRLSATVTSDAGVSSVAELGTFRISESKPVYASIDTSRLKFGPNAISVSSADGETSDATTVYRVHRPSRDVIVPIVFETRGTGPGTLDHAASLPASVLRVNSGAGAYDPLLTGLNASLAVMIDPNEQRTPGELVDRFPEARSWTVPVTNEFSGAIELAGFLRVLVPRPEIVIAPDNLESLDAYLTTAGHTVPDAVVVPDTDEVFAYRVRLEQAGYEFVSYRRERASLLDSESPLTPPKLETDAAEDDPLTRTLLNLWASFLTEYDVVGPYLTAEPVEATLFRHRRESGDWLLAVRSDESTAWTIPEALAVEYVYSPSFNMYPDVPERVDVGSDPHFLSGSAPNPLVESLTRQIQLELKTLTAVDSYMAAISNGLKTELNALLAQTPISDSRTAFLAMLRALPELEGIMMREQAPVHVMVPLIARLGRVARLVAALAEVESRPFLEPVSTMLTQSNRFVARYMGRNPDLEPDSRPGQLVEHIASLTEEASQLEADGLKIEAAGLAMLALWRSRSLMIYGDEQP